MKKTTYIIIIYIAATLLVSAFAFPIFYASLDKNVVKRRETVDLTVDLGGDPCAVALPGVTKLSVGYNFRGVRCVFIQSDTASEVTVIAPKGLHDNLYINVAGDSASLSLDFSSVRRAYDKAHPVTDLFPEAEAEYISDNVTIYRDKDHPGRSAFTRFFDISFTQSSNALVIIVPAGLSLEVDTEESLKTALVGFDGSLPQIEDANQVVLVNCRNLGNLRIMGARRVYSAECAPDECTPEAVLADGGSEFFAQ